MKGFLGKFAPRKCKLCKGKIEMRGSYRDGHDARPVTNGRCCSICNDLYVIPKRLKDIFAMMEKK